MKKTFGIAAIFFIACNSQPPKSFQEKAQDSVSAFVKRVTHDPASYQPVSYGKLDSAMSELRWYKNYFDLETDSSTTAIRLCCPELYNQTKTKATIDSISAELGKLRSSFNPEFKGYNMKHTFRAKNAFGALVVHDREFRLDSSLKVTSIDKQ